MLEVLAPAGSTEAVIAAVQSGADTVYMGDGLTAPGKSGADLDREGLSRSIRYCHTRGCKAVLSMSSLRTDESMSDILDLASFVSREGADALLVRDIGLITVLRRTLPEVPLWGDVRLGINSTEAVSAAAALGLSRVTLAPELSAEQIAEMARASLIETAVCVHGPVCVAHSGMCYMGALAHEHRSDNCMNCAMPCRGRFSLGGRMDERPLAIADVCLIDHLEGLDAVGVAGAVIEGRGRGPEYVAYVTKLYARTVREHVPPSADERETLRSVFSPGGLSDGYFAGELGPDLFALPEKTPDRSAAKKKAEVRKSYMHGELRRVAVKFYAVLQAEKPALFAAEDSLGRRAAYKGFVPTDLGRQGISEGRIREILYRTGGTPFQCEEVHCAVDHGLDYPDEAVEEARHALLASLEEKSGEKRVVQERERPPLPPNRPIQEAPKLIIQVTSENQLTEELAATGPDLLYVPAELLAARTKGVEPFLARGTEIAAVLPAVVSQAEKAEIGELLMTLKELGYTQVLAGDLGLLAAAGQAGMTIRGDYSLNVANSWTLERLGRAGLQSVTISCELSARQIASMAKPAPAEMIVYGRVPVMVTEYCLIRNSAGRCSCSTPTSMSDAFGGVYPVAKEFGCRNCIYDARKIFLADHPEVYTGVDLWGLRLLFTAESPRECVSVTQRYKGNSDYVPINASRGAYQKGALWI